MVRRVRIANSGFLWSSASTILVGVLGLVCLIVAARGLGPSEYVDFAVVWGVFFGLGGVFAGMQQEITRCITRSSQSGQVPLIRPTLLLSAPVAVVGALATQWSGGAASPISALAMAVGLLGLGGLTHLNGSLASSSRWWAVTAVLLVEAMVRTAVLFVVVLSDSRAGIVVAVVIGAITWPILLLGRTWRSAFTISVPVRLGGFMARAGGSMAAAGCGALLLAGFPLVAQVVRNDLGGPRVGAALAGLTLIRSGLLMPVFGMRPLVLNRFMADLGTPRSQGLWIFRAVLSCGGAYVLVVTMSGPWLLQGVLTDGFRLDRPTCAILAVGSTGVMTLVLCGLALLARGRHAVAALGWATALMTTAVLLAVPDAAKDAVVLSASLAPWVGVLVHAVAWSPRHATATVRVTSS